jgi:hypothetical protein
VAARIAELAGEASKRLGMSRRRFLASSAGMATAFVAMNEVFGRFFTVNPLEMFGSAYAQSGVPRDLFVFDDQNLLSRFFRHECYLIRVIAGGLGAVWSGGL